MINTILGNAYITLHQTKSGLSIGFIFNPSAKEATKPSWKVILKKEGYVGKNAGREIMSAKKKNE